MDIGLFLNAQAPAESDPQSLVRGLEKQVTAANKSGFDLALMGQHYLTETIQLQPIPMLARLSSVAGDLKLGTGVLLLPFHHPVAVAEHIATLDAVVGDSGTVLGVGAGYRQNEFDAFGIPMDERGSRLSEAVELISLLLSEPNVSYSGKYYSLDDITISHRPKEEPPIWFGAKSSTAVRRAGRLGDGWLVSPTVRLPQISEGVKHYREGRKQHADSGDGSIAIFREAFVAPTRSEARNACEQALMRKYAQYDQWRSKTRTDQSNVDFQQISEDRFIVGDPEVVCTELERYEKEVEADAVVLRMHWSGFPANQTVNSIQLTGDKVIPML